MLDTKYLSYFHGGPPPEKPEDLWEWLSSEGAKKPDGDAFVALHQPADHLVNIIPKTAKHESDNHLRWTYSQMLEAVEYVGRVLSQAGVKSGDVVSTFVPNSIEWALFLWVSFRLGCTFAPIDPTSLERPDELKYLTGTLNPKVVLVGDSNAANMYDQISSGHDLVKIICRDSVKEGKDKTIPSGWLSLQSLPCSTVSAPSCTRKFDPEAIAYIMFTSGTTSLPKGCPLTVHNIIAEIEGYHSFAGSQWDHTARFLATSMCYRPICYLGCLNSWRAGGCVAFAGTSFNTEEVIRAIKTEDITNLMLVATQVRPMSESPVLKTHRPTTLRFITCSGDTCSKDVIEKGREELQPKRFVPHWGMSEGAPLFGWLSEEEPPCYAPGNIPSIGRALPGTIARICESSDDGNSVVPHGIIGNLQVSSTSFINRYLSDEHTKKAFFNDEKGRRWFNTGDLAIADSSGAIFIVGRAKDIIINKGMNIVPSIMEECIESVYQREVSPEKGASIQTIENTLLL